MMWETTSNQNTTTTTNQSANRCLRGETGDAADDHGCYPEGHPFYDATHRGIDAMVAR
jgi:hypothetical protein